jgi:hypothetical protein
LTFWQTRALYSPLRFELLGLPCHALSPQPLAILMEGLLRPIVIRHGLCGIHLSEGLPRFALSRSCYLPLKYRVAHFSPSKFNV